MLLPTRFRDSYFEISARGSTIPREILAGLTIFATMSHVWVVHPQILAVTGMDLRVGSYRVATHRECRF
jgi:xanthine/uracil/vitamin C permease (AzgA family)